jgi:hypothetical protein
MDVWETQSACSCNTVDEPNTGLYEICATCYRVFELSSRFSAYYPVGNSKRSQKYIQCTLLFCCKGCKYQGLKRLRLTSKKRCRCTCRNSEGARLGREASQKDDKHKYTVEVLCNTPYITRKLLP